MLPKHSNPTKKRFDRNAKKSFWAYAPYNFIPLPDKLVTVTELPDQDSYTNNTGYIKCTMKTESPLYVRCPMTPSFFSKYGDKKFYELDHDQKNECAHFFYREQKNCPVIPGSSLRGMIRSLVEIVGYGKMQWVTDDTKMTYRAVASSQNDPLSEPYKNILGKSGNKVNAGYLIKHSNEWWVKPAKRPLELGFPDKTAYLKIKEKNIPENAINGFKKLNDDEYKPQYHEISFNADILESKKGNKYTYIKDLGSPGNGKYKGFLVCSGNMLETNNEIQSNRNSHVIILEKNEEAEELKINEQAIKNYVSGLTPFQKEPPFNDIQGCLIEGLPIFYVERGGEVFFFGHCPNFRVPAIFPQKTNINSPIGFVPEYLRSENAIDIAEAIFGYIHGKTDSRAGRVFFTDARVEYADEGIWFDEETVTPKILASPKPTTFQHYLVQDMHKFHDPDQKVNLAHYATPSPDDTVIRGYKMYWHKGEVKLEDIKELDRNIEKSPTQYTRIKPIKSGVIFSFRIYFENLRDFELGTLLWALTLPGEKGKEYRHSLGMGKPFGMGAIKIEPKLYESKRDERYRKLFDGDSWHEAVHKVPEKSKKELIQTFEKYILDQIGEEESQLNKVDRIKMLLQMMEWNGPNTDLTRYLQINPINEYKERPVLPDPFNISPP
ncbi:CRISPR-associated RAMP family protein [Methanosarcina sp. A14]|uniref:TIGR03986 family type III CRISPR-associated RAMP protein n=1 Tax=Methanosarcina TaxID=2207 RepID=UPI000698810C|nr:MULTISPECIES: TIGR03986 family CRISPR-associated RAMP protein [Methanosarcina]OEC96870.1 CRISPR-associated RAMP family protein [Methanosarcina sp. A14]